MHGERGADAPGSPSHLLVGRVGRPHGIGGAALVHPLTDRPDWVYRRGFELYGAPEGEEPGGSPALVIARAREAGRGWAVRFRGVADRSRAAELRHLLLFAPLETLAPLEEGEYFHFQLVGLEAVTVGGDAVGRVSEVIEVGESTLLEVESGGRRRLIPFRPFVVEVDLERGRLVVDPPEGLLEL